LKNYLYSTSFEKEINIFIEDNISKKIINKYQDYYSSLMVFESNLRDVFKIKNQKFIRSGKDAKSLDKFLDLSDKINKDNISNLICFGGNEVLSLAGYTYNSVGFNKNLLIFIPTNLKSMIVPPLKGSFNLNMNFQEDFLQVDGYPNFLYVDPLLIKENPKLTDKKSFIYPFFLGYINESKYSDLTRNYVKKYNDLDFFDFINNGLSFSISLLSSYGYFPGDRIKNKIFRKNILFKNDIVEIDGFIFLFVLFISYLKGFISIEKVEQFLSFLHYLGFNIKNLIKQVDIINNTKAIKDIIIEKGKCKQILMTYQEIKNYMEEFLIFLRGELF
jgi:hypothetical protein